MCVLGGWGEGGTLKEPLCASSCDTSRGLIIYDFNLQSRVLRVRDNVSLIPRLTGLGASAKSGRKLGN